MGEISAAFPFESKFVTVDGVRMHYIDEGEGTPIVFLHGNPTSSYLWRNVIPHLKPLGRTIAPDLVGMGKSGRPDGFGFTLQDHYKFVEGFINALGLKNIVLVIHDWGSALGLMYARRHTDNVKAVAFMEAVVPPFLPLKKMEDFGPIGEAFRVFRDPVQGPKVLMEQNQFIENILPGAILRKLTEEEMNYYRAPYQTPESRRPLYTWPNDIPIEGKPERNVKEVEELGKWLSTAPTPKLVIYASPGVLVPPWAAQWMLENYKNIEARFVGKGSHFIQEDEPELIGRNIADWLKGLANRGAF